MKHVGDVAELSLSGSHLTIGVFDGVHRGHQAILTRLVAGARAADLPAVALTFHPHPSAVLPGRTPVRYLTTPEVRAELMGALGVDYVVTQRFDHALSQLEPETFLDLLAKHLAFKGLWVGEDFAFGRQRRGDLAFLGRTAPERGFELHVIPPLEVDGQAVGSSRIREALLEGEVAEAAALLGRPFSLAGTVVKGAGRGRDLGYPTANLRVDLEMLVPGFGIYACIAHVGGRAWPAATSIGVRPTVEEEGAEAVVEAYLIDYRGDLYGKVFALDFIARLRDEIKFDDVDALAAQIGADVEQARALLDPQLQNSGV